MIKLSELQQKEIITIKHGRRLGYLSDLEIDTNQGKIIALIIFLREKSGLFGKSDELFIYWEQIVTIGSDVILIQDPEEPKLYE